MEITLQTGREAVRRCTRMMLELVGFHLMMLEASSASGSGQYLFARIRQASADSIC